jgi:hypothetical protein
LARPAACDSDKVDEDTLAKSQGATFTPSKFVGTALTVVPALTVATDNNVRVSNGSTEQIAW